MTILGIISPGKMGASVGAAARRHTKKILWPGENRSPASHQRALDAGLEDCGSLTALCAESDMILSVCPPHDARAVAESVMQASFEGVYVDCNAISPQKTQAIGQTFEPGKFVDGGIVGGPAWRAADNTRLYLSGTRATEVAALFRDSPLQATIISEDIGAASAMKMVFAAFTKGSTALLAAIMATAEHYEVRETLQTQWGDEFTNQTINRLLSNTAKAWRFEGEMHEIADTFAAAGMPDGFHRAAGEVFSELSTFKNAPAASVDELLKVLLENINS